MKTRQSSLVIFTNALATAFDLFPAADYRKAYPSKSPARRMDEAWFRTGRDMRSTMNGIARKHVIAR